MRAVIAETWEECASQKISVVVATATTAAILIAVQKIEAELLIAVPLKNMFEQGKLPEAHNEFGKALKYVEPHPSDEFGYVKNPFYSGTVLIKMVVQYQKLGLTWANTHPSIVIMAHLYNSVRQFHLLLTRWPVMERIIELHTNAIFADAIPTKMEDMNTRLLSCVDQDSVWREYGDEKCYLKPHPAISILELTLSNDPKDQAKGHSPLKYYTSKSVDASRKRHGRAKPHLHDAQEALTNLFDDMSIDYIRLTSECIRLLWLITQIYNKEMVQLGFKPFPFPEPPMDQIPEAKDWGCLMLAQEVFTGTIRMRESKAYSYEAGDGYAQAAKGYDPDVKHPYRHGLGQNVVSKVLYGFLNSNPLTFWVQIYKFPEENDRNSTLFTGDIEMVDETEQHTVRQLASADEISALLASTTYVVLDFYHGVDQTRPHYPGFVCALHQLAKNFSEPDTLAFGEVNRLHLQDEVERHCKNPNVETFVFFTDGNRVAANGHQEISALDSAALRAAIGKSGVLAKQRVAARTESAT
ncbi:hypothetical protein E8E11_009366 [Didymella keratinophila]|nr:hypothetical protein E8E11_009366 [Didymella keratinophila]